MGKPRFEGALPQVLLGISGCCRSSELINDYKKVFSAIGLQHGKSIDRLYGVKNVDWERFIPGTIAVEGREHMYIEIVSRKMFDNLFSKMAQSCRGIPKEGGAIEERTTIRMPSGKLMQGISYKGDLEGWRSCITAFCEQNEIPHGKIEGDCIVLTSGESAPLTDCKIEMW